MRLCFFGAFVGDVLAAGQRTAAAGDAVMSAVGAVVLVAVLASYAARHEKKIYLARGAVDSVDGKYAEQTANYFIKHKNIPLRSVYAAGGVFAIIKVRIRF